jgi:hypothetical protein
LGVGQLPDESVRDAGVIVELLTQDDCAPILQVIDNNPSKVQQTPAIPLLHHLSKILHQLLQRHLKINQPFATKWRVITAILDGQQSSNR